MQSRVISSDQKTHGPDPPVIAVKKLVACLSDSWAHVFPLLKYH